MRYYNFLELDGWEEQAKLILQWAGSDDSEVYKKWFYHEFKDDLDQVVKWFAKFGLTPNEFFVIRWPESHADITDTSHPQCCFIHTDQKEGETGVIPEYSLNLPLKNCNEGIIRFYEVIDHDNTQTYYDSFDSPGYSPNAVKEVAQFILTKPAVMRVNIPHSIENPTPNPRITACFRFKDDLSTLLNFS